MVIMIAERRAPRQMLDRRRDPALELTIIIAVEQVMLAIVLILDEGVGLRQPLREQSSFRIALDPAAISIAAPIQIDVRKVRLIMPQPLVDHRLQARAISAGLRPKDASTRAPQRRLLGCPFRDQRGRFRPVTSRSGVILIRLVQRHDGTGGAVDKVDLFGKGVAEKSGYAQRHVHARSVQLGNLHHLETDDPSGSPLPSRPHTHQRQRLRDIVAARPHVGRAPG